MLERIRERLRRAEKSGRTHLEGRGIVTDAFQDGVTQAFLDLANHPSPAVSEPFFDNFWKQVKRHPFLTTLAFGALATVSVRTARTIIAHEKSQKWADEMFEDYLGDPLAPRDCSAIDDDHPEPRLNLKRVRELGETAIKKERGEEFIKNLFDSAIRHPDEGVEFLMKLDPHGIIFTFLLDPDTRDIRHRNQELGIVVPSFQSKYQSMIDKMTEELDRLVPQLDQGGNLKMDRKDKPLSYRTVIYDKLKKR